MKRWSIFSCFRVFMFFPAATFAHCAAAFSVCAVGDSITEGGPAFVAHRVALEGKFAELGWNVEWKGSHVKSGSGSSNPCEGWSGQDAETIVGKYEENATGDRADVLLLHAGHNYNAGDAGLSPSPMGEEAIIAAVTNAHKRIIQTARANNPDVIVLYAKVITSGGNRAVKYSYIPALNNAIGASDITKAQIAAATDERIPVLTVPVAYDPSGATWQVVGASATNARYRWVADDGGTTKTLRLFKPTGLILIFR